MCYVIRQMGYVRLRPRLWPLYQDEEKRERFKEELVELENSPDVEIWYGDESGFQGDPKPRRVLCKKGSRPRISYTGAHLKENVIGAVRPSDGEFVSLIMPTSNTFTFQLFLDEMQKYISSEKRVILILDNAGWHKTKALNWGGIEPFYLPAYSPDLNPIERLWLDIKERFFNSFTAVELDELTDHLIEALRYYIYRPSICKSLCGR